LQSEDARIQIDWESWRLYLIAIVKSFSVLCRSFLQVKKSDASKGNSLMTIIPSADKRSLIGQLSELSAKDSNYAVRFVEVLLAQAVAMRASDIHLQPRPDGLHLALRLDGVVQSIGAFPVGAHSDVVARLKVLAGLLTYRTDIPQEGRWKQPRISGEIRVSTFPTLYGERVAIRLLATQAELQHFDQLGFPETISSALGAALQQTSGVVLITGPAGSGKTTTAYACLRAILADSRGGRAIVTLEDPIESDLPGVAQSQVNTNGAFDMPTGLRSIVRQDPDVIFVGEIRDAESAYSAFQASLTGHLVITTFHAGSSADAVVRLIELGIEPYSLRSGLRCVVCQRLVRRLCSCKRRIDDVESSWGLNVPQAFEAGGCSECLQLGYKGRSLLAELMATSQPDLQRGIKTGADSADLSFTAKQQGMIDLRAAAIAAVSAGLTSPAELVRVFGLAALKSEQNEIGSGD
jgi:general secretion pathway protein E